MNLFLNVLRSLLLVFSLATVPLFADTITPQDPEGLKLYYWQQKDFVNFGDYLAVKIVERVLGQPVVIYKKTKVPRKKFLALGSMLYFATDDDVLWGTGSNNKQTTKEQYSFKTLDIRALRGPLTKAFIEENWGISCPDVFGDPALLFPYLFPEFKKSDNPNRPYIVIPHFYQRQWFSPDEDPAIVLPTEHWTDVISKIIDSKFVISGSLHGIIIAEAYGIPARYLRLSEQEPLFKYQDYYMSTGRPDFKYASTIEEALEMGGEPPIIYDPELLYDAFPFEFWPSIQFKRPNFPPREKQ